jgi:hypothetical protein
MDDNHKLKWRFDVSTFRLIGRDLITDRVTALFELVKNCYDANAQNVNVIFENVGAGKKQAVIRVEDDGYGMSFEVFGTNGWLLERQVNALVHIHLNPSIENVLEKKV